MTGPSRSMSPRTHRSCGSSAMRSDSRARNSAVASACAAHALCTLTDARSAPALRRSARWRTQRSRRSRGSTLTVSIHCKRPGLRRRHRNAAIASPDRSCRPQRCSRIFPTRPTRISTPSWAVACADAWPISASAGRSKSLPPKCEAHMDKVLAGPAMKQNLVSRRSFLIGAAGTSVLFGFPRPGFTAADAASTSPAALFEPTIWYRVDRSGIVTVSIIRAEMGQHVGTALARIVADELEADWDKVRLDYVDTDPKWGLMLTGASWSVWQTFMPFSQAGAAGRIALIEEAAKLLNVDKEACSARNGAVSAGDRSITYGDIVARGSLKRTFTADQLKAMPIKKPADRRLIGHDTKAIDIPAKTNGAARHGIDAEVDDMVYARPKIPPTRYGSKVVSIDDSAAKSVKGYIKSIALDDPSDTVPGWVMVLADSFFAADRAADKVKVEWIPGDAVNVSEQDLQDHGAKLIADPSGGSLLVDDPGVEAAFAAAKSTLERTYTTSSALQFQLEPVNALAFEKNGIFEIHTGNHWPGRWLSARTRSLCALISSAAASGGGSTAIMPCPRRSPPKPSASRSRWSARGPTTRCLARSARRRSRRCAWLSVKAAK